MQEIDTASIHSNLVWLTLGITSVMGFVMARSNFCTMGAVADIANMGDWSRMRMWLLAIAVAIAGAQSLHLFGVVNLSKSIYTAPNITWASNLLGGFLFGFGMVLAGGCGSKTLIRIGGGSLKSLVVFIVLGFFAYMTMKGIFGVARVATVDTLKLSLGTSQDLPSITSKLFAIDANLARTIVTCFVAAFLAVFALKSKEFRASGWNIVGAIVIGLGVTAVWYLSGKLGYIAEDPKTLEEAFIGTNSGRIESLSFVAPMAYVLELFMFWSDTSKLVTVGIAACGGMILGALMSSILDKSFAWQGFSGAEDTTYHLAGAALMGIGGATAVGCTVGQGLTGLSTLAVGSFLAFAAIVAGGFAGIKFQMSRL